MESMPISFSTYPNMVNIQNYIRVLSFVHEEALPLGPRPMVAEISALFIWSILAGPNVDHISGTHCSYVFAVLEIKKNGKEVKHKARKNRPSTWGFLLFILQGSEKKLQFLSSMIDGGALTLPLPWPGGPGLAGLAPQALLCTQRKVHLH